jgi:Uma2 family endonuclease
MSRSSFPLSEWTYSEYARLPDDGDHYEVIDGEVCVTPAPGVPHQRVAARLFGHLSAYVEANGLGEVLWDVDVLLIAGQYLRPDMVFVPPDALLTDRGVESAPGLVVEVLSAHSGHIDRVKKPPRYREFGVPEYWVVDHTSRAVEVYRLREGIVTPDVRTDRVVWQPVAHAPLLELEVQKLF